MLITYTAYHVHKSVNLAASPTAVPLAPRPSPHSPSEHYYGTVTVHPVPDEVGSLTRPDKRDSIRPLDRDNSKEMILVTDGNSSSTSKSDDVSVCLKLRGTKREAALRFQPPRMPSDTGYDTGDNVSAETLGAFLRLFGVIKGRYSSTAPA
ncbi:hypothetical protein J6590_041636 [Homalodisca vitripennis]|nr:hypothetical protein J6590_041636 [Homalodisca vitripennis]